MSLFTELIPEEKVTTISDDYMNLVKESGQITLLKKLQAIKAGFLYIPAENVLNFLRRSGESFLKERYKIVEFNGIEILCVNFLCADKWYHPWRYLRSQIISENLIVYPGCIPQKQLSRIKFAKKLNMFDKINIWSYSIVQTLPDPVAVGIIDGLTGFFFITQWDSDLTLDDLI